MEQRVVAVFATHVEVTPCGNLLRHRGALEYAFVVVSSVLDGPLVETVEKCQGFWLESCTIKDLGG